MKYGKVVCTIFILSCVYISVNVLSARFPVCDFISCNFAGILEVISIMYVSGETELSE